MPSGLSSRFLLTLAVGASASGCSLLLSFDPPAGVGCDGGSCQTFVVSPDSLRAHASDPLPVVGSAARASALASDPQYAELLGQEFNALTPETEMVWENIHPEAGRWEFDQVDQLVAFAQAHEQKLRWKNLLWHAGAPSYLSGLDAASLQLEVRDHIATVMGRYGTSVAVWDVVDEVLDDDGNLRPSVFLDQLGQGYIAAAFNQAHQLAPQAQLALVDAYSEIANPRGDALYALLKGLKDAGVPVDVVGLKYHVKAYDFASFRMTETRLREAIQRYASLGLKVHITAMDVTLAELDLPSDLKRRYQKEVYNLVGSICRSEPACEWLSTWGFTDQYSWLNTASAPDQPLLLDEAYNRKPAYFGLRDALDGVVTADVDLGYDTVCRSRPEALVCEPFESLPVRWSTYSPIGQVSTSALQHERGARSLWSSSDGGLTAQMSVDHLGAIRSGPLYTRAYIYLPAANPSRIYLLGLREYSPYGGVYGGVKDGGLSLALNTARDDGGADVWVQTGVPLPVGRWACLELALNVSETGSASLYLDGNLVVTQTNVDTLPAQGITQLVTGLVSPNLSGEIYVDEVVVSRTPIGCDP